MRKKKMPHQLHAAYRLSKKVQEETRSDEGYSLVYSGSVLYQSVRI
jgi:hypothetical protein